MSSDEFLSKPLKDFGLPTVQFASTSGITSAGMLVDTSMPSLKRGAYSTRNENSALEDENPTTRKKKNDPPSQRFGDSNISSSSATAAFGNTNGTADANYDDEEVGDDYDEDGDDYSGDEDDTGEGKGKSGMFRAPRKPNHWTADEDAQLRAAVQLYGEKHWRKIAEMVRGRNQTQCLQRWQKVLRPGLKKGQWDQEEDDLLIKIVSEQKKRLINLKSKIQWNLVAKEIPGRTPKQCRERWNHNINPCIRKGPWEAWEDKILLEKVKGHGAQHWSFIARFLDESIPGKEITYRTEAATKNRYRILMKEGNGSSLSTLSDAPMQSSTLSENYSQRQSNESIGSVPQPVINQIPDMKYTNISAAVPSSNPSFRYDPNQNIDSTMKSLSSLSVSQPTESNKQNMYPTQMASATAPVENKAHYQNNPDPFQNASFSYFPSTSQIFNLQPTFSRNSSMPIMNSYMAQNKEKSAEMMSQLNFILSQVSLSIFFSLFQMHIFIKQLPILKVHNSVCP